MTTEEFISSHADAAFGEGNAKLGYHRSDNWEASARKLRHAFWKGAEFVPVKDVAGCYLATLAKPEDAPATAKPVERIVFGK